MIRKSWNVVDYQEGDHKNTVDYSEVVTEPGLVLSMREIYYRYASAGVDLLKGELIDDEQDLDDVQMSEGFEDNVDLLQQSTLLRQRSAASLKRSARTAEKAPQGAGKTEDRNESDKEEQSDDAKES